MSEEKLRKDILKRLRMTGRNETICLMGWETECLVRWIDEMRKEGGNDGSDRGTDQR